MTTLYYKDNTSDKVYQAVLVEVPGGFNINFAYGRRGSTLTTGVKNSAPLPKDAADKMLAKLLQEKMAKGYTPGEDGASYTNTVKEDRFTGILPMLLNSIEEAELECFLDNDNWVAEEKFDGVRMLLRKNADGSVDAINRKGLLVGAPEPILAEARRLPGQFVLDGECVGEHFYAFDHLLDGIALWCRQAELYRLLTSDIGPALKHIHIVPCAVGSSMKRRLLADLRKANAEGIVLKHQIALYTPGRPNSGGYALKFKFKACQTFRVAGINTKRSVQLSTYDLNGSRVFLGNVTIPADKGIPQVGDFVDIEYLYAFKGGSLFQPVYKGKRNDVEADTYDQVKFKADGDRDEEDDVPAPDDPCAGDRISLHT